MKKRKKALFSIIGAIVLGGSLGVASYSLENSYMKPQVYSLASHETETKVEGEQETFLDVDLEMFSEGNGSNIQNGLLIRPRIKSRFKNPALLQYAYYLVDEDGNIIKNPFTSFVKNARKGHDEIFDTLTVKKKVRDGFYQLRFIAAGYDGDFDEAVEREYYLKVEDRKIKLLTANEWFEQSLTNLAYSEDDGSEV